jgi:MoaA/NifB/PqqE/SkfB family radical SAM enzyme
MITKNCNQNCPYCFARDRMKKGDKSQDISLMNIKIIANIFRQWKIDQFRLIGGEPTTHPLFKKIIDYLVKEHFKIHIFTNGLLEKDLVDFLVKKPNISYLLNLNHPKSYATDTFVKDPQKKIAYFLKKEGSRIKIGVNVYNENFSGEYLIKTIKQYHLAKEIRIGFANPIYNPKGLTKNAFLKPETYRQAMEKIVSFSKDCDKKDITFHFDCVIPLCVLKKEELGEIFLNTRTVPRTVCTGPIDIGTDLKIWRCFATSQIFNERKITEFQNPQEVFNYFKKEFKKFEPTKGIFKKCATCHYKKRQQCQGGCLSFSLLVAN